VDQVTPEKIAANGGPAPRTLYRWRKTWEQQGITGLLAPPARLPTPRLDAATLRNLLHTLSQKTTFSLGCLPQARALLPQQRDPAERGRILAWALTEALRSIDTEIEQRHGVADLTTCRFLQRTCVKTLGDTTALSERSVYRLLNEALDDVVEWLPTFLEQPPPPPTWAAYIDHTQHIADLAAWQQAGWNVLAARYESQASDPLCAFVAALHAQLADIGALETAEPGLCCCFSQQLAIVKTALHSMPIVFVHDNIDADEQQCAWTAVNMTLLHPATALKLFHNGTLIHNTMRETHHVHVSLYQAA
jgi:transposase-like protein